MFSMIVILVDILVIRGDVEVFSFFSCPSIIQNLHSQLSVKDSQTHRFRFPKRVDSREWGTMIL